MNNPFRFRKAISRVLLPMALAGVFSSVAPTVFAQPPAAQPPAAEPPGKNAEKGGEQSADKQFSKALDSLEQEIARQERSSDYGNKKIEAYARELEAEYLSNQATMSDLSATGSPDRKRRRLEISSRQQHLSLLLWELKRVGAEIAKPGTSSRTVLTEMQKLLSQHRQVMTNAALMKRYHDLMRRAAELTRVGMLRRAQPNNFHFVRPENAKGNADVIAAANATSDSDLEVQQAKLRQGPRLRQGPKLRQGPMQELQAPIGNLVRLSWKTGQLRWDSKHWETPFAGQTLQSIVEQVNTELLTRGVKLPEEDRSRTFQMKRLFETPLAALLFQDLQYTASGGKPPSRSSSSTGSTSRSRFATKAIEGSILLAPQKSEFSIREENGPARTLDVRQENENELRVSLIGEHILILEQSADGSVRWVDIGDEVTVIDAPSFAQLYAKHPEKVEDELFPRLEHCGILAPMKRYDNAVVQRALQRLEGVDEQTRTKFSELLTLIDSGSFGERQKAYRDLSTNVEKYCLLLAETSDDDGRSAEATTRLAELRKAYDEQFGEVDDLIKQTGWLTDPNYLSGLVDKVDRQHASLINARLEQLSR